MAGEKSGSDEASTAALTGKLETEKTEYIEFRSEDDGKVYAGDFTWKRMTLGDLAAVGVDTARRNGNLTAIDETTDLLNTMFSHFRYGIKKSPDWFKDPESLYDANLLRKVFEGLVKFQKTFRGNARLQDAGASSSGGGA